MAERHDIENKPDIERIEDVKGLDGAEDVLKPLDEERVVLTQEDNDRLRKLFDRRILPILIWVYLLQILDKQVMGYGNIYGLSVDTGLKGRQYSIAATMNNIAQACIMPFSAWLIVKVPPKILMPVLVFCWGASITCMAAASNFAGLCVTRFLLGLFEAGCLPLFSVITAHWYRRSEQPIRICAWYSTNGVGQIIAAVGSFGLGKINSNAIHSWQIIFMFVGLVTVITAPFVYYFLENNIQTASFLTEQDREMAIERVRANQTGTGSTDFKWAHIWEMVYDPKTWLFGGLALCLNFGAAVSTAFGPTLIRGFGFEKDVTALLNAPFGALQIITIWSASFATQHFRLKGVVLVAVALPVITGIAMLYQTNLQPEINRTQALVGYYLLATLFAGNPIIVSWMVANTAGQTKKSAILSVYNLFNAIGSIIGPLLFTSTEAPRYLTGIRSCLGVFSTMVGLIGVCYTCLFLLNKQRERQRIAVGKPAKFTDTSMSKRYQTYGNEGGLGENALLDLTDFKNNEFVYVY